MSSSLPVVARDARAGACRRGFRQPVGAADLQVHGAAAEPVEHLRGTPDEFVAVEDVMGQRRGAGHEDRPGRIESLQIDRRHLAARATEEHDHAAGTQRGQGGVEVDLPTPS